jgi:thioredoxin 1
VKKKGYVTRAATGLLVIALLIIFGSSTRAFCQDFSKLPVKGMVTMLDLGAKKCIPCRMMAPIMVKMEAAYKGRAHIVFIDVWENRDQARRFHLRAIPIQIFFQ